MPRAGTLDVYGALGRASFERNIEAQTGQSVLVWSKRAGDVCPRLPAREGVAIAVSDLQNAKGAKVVGEIGARALRGNFGKERSRLLKQRYWDLSAMSAGSPWVAAESALCGAGPHTMKALRRCAPRSMAGSP